MKWFSKFILNIAIYSFFVSLISVFIGYLSTEESTMQANSYDLALSATVITIFILLFHLLITVISFIINNKFSKFILNVAIYSFFVSIISLIIGFLSKEDSPTQANSYGIALFGTIITICILLFHLFITVISFIINLIKKDHS